MPTGYPISFEKIGELRELRKQGIPLSEIAVKESVGKSTVYRHTKDIFISRPQPRSDEIIMEHLNVTDFAVTENHPVYTRNKGEILAGDIKEGDLLNELLWENGALYLVPVPIELIEKFTFEGKVYDIKTETKWLFGNYLLGHTWKL